MALSEDPVVAFRLSHAIALAEVRVKVDLMLKVAFVIGGGAVALLGGILLTLLMRG